VQVIAEDVRSRQTSSTNVTIRMTDINDNPPDFGTDVLYASVVETSKKNTVVTTVTVSSHTVVLHCSS